MVVPSRYGCPCIETANRPGGPLKTEGWASQPTIKSAYSSSTSAQFLTGPFRASALAYSYREKSPALTAETSNSRACWVPVRDLVWCCRFSLLGAQGKLHGFDLRVTTKIMQAK